MAPKTPQIAERPYHIGSNPAAAKKQVPEGVTGSRNIISEHHFGASYGESLLARVTSTPQGNKEEDIHSMLRTKLQKALERGFRPDGDLSAELGQLGDYRVRSKRDAGAICQALSQFSIHRPDDGRWPALLDLTAMFQGVSGSGAFRKLSEQGILQLVRIFDETWEYCNEDNDTLPFLLKIFAMFHTAEGFERVVRAARHLPMRDHYLWSVIFSQFDRDHPHRLLLCEALRDPLPSGYVLVAYLDFVNALVREGEVLSHPFDSKEGHRNMRHWLTSSDPDQYTYAHSATASLPYIARPNRDELLALALDHCEPRVQLEGAWASASLGAEAGVRYLSRMCLERDYSQVACGYLNELGRGAEIPSTAYEPSFQAEAELSHWLAHPNEFAVPPDDVELIDTRRAYWPPTNDRRTLWLFQYRYRAGEGVQGEELGVGMVGSVTFSLYDQATDNLSPEEVYALHCCWELMTFEDPRAPQKLSVDAGRDLLGQAGW